MKKLFSLLWMRAWYVLMTVFLTMASFSPLVATEFVGEMSEETLGVGSEFVLTVSVDTAGEHLNAFEGSVAFPKDMLRLKELRDAGSIITSWVDQPYTTKEGRIHFSGITAGGYQGEKGFLFSAVFQSLAKGEGFITLSVGRAFKNDGEGTSLSLSGDTSTFRIDESPQRQPRDEPDSTPPEDFEVSLVEDANAFDGQPFLVFATADKGRGMGSYELCVGFFAECHEVQSPYLLKEREESFFLNIKALDLSGNVRTAYLFTPQAFIRYSLYLILAILVCVGIVFVILRARRSRSF